MLAHLILAKALQGWYDYLNLHVRKLHMRSSVNWFIEFRLRRKRKEWPQVSVNAFHYATATPKFSQHLRPTLLVSVVSFLNTLEVEVDGRGYGEHMMRTLDLHHVSTLCW